MDIDEVPVPYSEFTRTVCPLAHGCLKVFAENAAATWNAENIVQVQSKQTLPRSSGGERVTVTDGCSMALINLPSSQAASVSLGSIVSLVGLRHGLTEFAANDLILHKSPDTSNVPMIDSSKFTMVVPSSPAVPATFSAHLARKRAAPADDSQSRKVPAAAASASSADERPRMINPFSQKTHVAAAGLQPPLENFCLGPVIVHNITAGQPTRSGKTSPSSFVVEDETRTRITYKTWHDFTRLQQMFADHKTACFWLAGGIVQLSGMKERPGPPEILVDLDPSRSSDIKQLFVHKGTDEENKWLRRHLRQQHKTITVAEAIDIASGSTTMRNQVLVGVLDKATVNRTKNGADYWSISLVDRREPGAALEKISFNIFSNRVNAFAFLLDRYRATNGYDRAISDDTTPVVIEISGLVITPHLQFKYELDFAATIEQVFDYDESRVQMVEITSLTSNPVVTLAELYSGPPNTLCNVYVVVPHMTEMRPYKRIDGTLTGNRKLSIMDDSVNLDGQPSIRAITAWPNNPLPDVLVANGEPKDPAFSSITGTDREYQIVDPTKVPVMLMMGVEFKPPEEPGRTGYMGTKQTRFKVIPPDSEDARAVALRKWYAETGHVRFIPQSGFSQDYLDVGEYTSAAAAAAATSIAAAPVPAQYTRQEMADMNEAW